jgi:hypothetical protein
VVAILTKDSRRSCPRCGELLRNDHSAWRSHREVHRQEDRRVFVQVLPTMNGYPGESQDTPLTRTAPERECRKERGRRARDTR